MKCERCGAATRSGRENYLHRESGANHVTLVDIEVARCIDRGEHAAIAAALSRKAARLLPEEIRFLRKQLGWSGVEFAAPRRLARDRVALGDRGGRHGADR